MKKALIALVAIAVVVGFVGMSMAAETGEMKVKAKTTEKAGVETTKLKATEKLGKPGSEQKITAKVKQVTRLGDGYTVTYYKMDDAGMKNPIRAKIRKDVPESEINKLREHAKTQKGVIFSSYPITPQTAELDAKAMKKGDYKVKPDQFTFDHEIHSWVPAQ